MLRMTNEFYTSLKVSAEETKIIDRWQRVQDYIINVCKKSYSAVLTIYLCTPLFKGKALPLQGMLPNGVAESPW